MSKVIFVTGASGVGKTTLVSELKKKHKDNGWVFLHFDSIGVPSEIEMVSQFGSAENWQRETAYKWINKILNKYKEGVVILEGQVNLEFIKEGFDKYNFTNYKIVLIDCSEEEMTRRLKEDRNQPELLTDEMKNWLKMLRRQAKHFRASVVDTSDKDVHETVDAFEDLIMKII